MVVSRENVIRLEDELRALQQHIEILNGQNHAMTNEIDDINRRDEAIRREMDDRRSRLAGLRATNDGDLRSSYHVLSEKRHASPKKRVYVEKY